MTARIAVLMCAALTFVSGCGAAEPTQAVLSTVDTTIFVPPATIDATGSADVTRELNQFFASVPDSSIVRLPPGAQYRIEGTLFFRDRHGLTIEGNGATFLALTNGSDATPTESFGHLWPRTRQHFFFLGGSNITIRDVTITGANPSAGSAEGAYIEAFEGQHGLRFSGVQEVELERVTVTDVYGDFLYLGGSGGIPTRDVHVVGARFDRSGRQGVAITGAEDVLIENSHIGEVGRTIIDLEPNTANGIARRITFRDNTFGPCRHLLLSAGGRGPNVGDVLFLNNTLVGMQLKIRVAASDGSRRGPFRIVGNRSDRQLGTLTAGLRFTRIDGVEVRGNVQPMRAVRNMTAVHAVESCDVVVEGNEFPGAARIAEIEPYACPGS